MSPVKKIKNNLVKIDKSLNKYDNVVLFPEKVEKANEMLRTIGLPEIQKKGIHPTK